MIATAISTSVRQHGEATGEIAPKVPASRHPRGFERYRWGHERPTRPGAPQSMCWPRPTTWRSSRTRSTVKSMISSEASVRFEQVGPTRARRRTASQGGVRPGPEAGGHVVSGREQRSADLLFAPALRLASIWCYAGTRSDGRAGDRCGSPEMTGSARISLICTRHASARLIGTSAYFCMSAKLRSGPDIPRGRRSEPPRCSQAGWQGWAGRVRQEGGKPPTGPLHRSSRAEPHAMIEPLPTHAAQTSATGHSPSSSNRPSSACSNLPAMQLPGQRGRR